MKFTWYRSIRFVLLAGSIAGMLVIFTLVTLNTTRTLKSFTLDQMRVTIAQTSETLNLAIAHHTTTETLGTLQDYLNGLVRGDEHGVIYLALLDDAGRIIAHSRSTPDPLPAASDPAGQINDSAIHVGQPVLFADNRVGELRYGLSTRLLQETNARILAENLMLMAGLLAVGIALLIAASLWVSRKLEQLMTASQQLAAGNLRHRAPDFSATEFALLAQNFNRMADAVESHTNALQESHRRFRTLFESSPVATWLLDEHRFVDCNSAAVALLGFTGKEQFSKVHPADISPEHQPDGESSFAKAERMMTLTNQQGFIRFEWLHKRVDDSTFLAEVTLSDIVLQDKHVIYAVVRDITESKRAQEALEHERGFLRTLIETVPDLVWLKDPDGVYLSCNRRFERLYGAKLADIVGKTDYDFVDKDLADFFRAHDRKAIDRNGPSVNEEWVTFGDDGHRELLETTKTPMFGSKGQLIGVLGVGHDITERKRAEEELSTYREHLEELVITRTSELEVARAHAEHLTQVKSEFLANMSHEIRTPLNAVLGLAQIGMRGDQEARPSEIFGRIFNSGEHLLQLINDILDFSKIEAGKLAVESRPFQLEAVVRAAVDMVASHAAGKGLTLNAELAPGLPHWTKGDPLRTQQILVNLLSNAVKFTEQGVIGLSVTQEGSKICFRVADSGIGMTHEQVTRIFQPFEQADGSTTRRFGGTGLGLAISNNLANLMGGSIEAESVFGAGSTFRLRLPLPEAAPPVPVAPGQTSQGPRLAHLRLLAAEDIEVNRFILEDMLTREGAHVTFAVNGRQALERLDELGLGAFDAVLMDVQMPVMGGHEAARRIREFAPALPVIGLTAHALPEEREKCLESGMCEHVTKPIDSEELVAAILRNVRSPGDRYQPLQTSPALAGAPTAVNPPLSASIDLVALASRYSGHRSLVDRILGIAATKYADLPGRLRAAVSTRDLNELRFLAHTIKGISGSLEAHPAYEQAEHTEVLAKAADDQAFDRAARLADTLEELLTALASIPRDAGGEFRLPTDPGA